MMSFSSRFIKDELISEGQALTWKGHDAQTGSLVVIKELRLSDRSQWKGLELFEREVQVLRQLKHASIPALLDADLGQEDSQTWHLAQEWIGGEDLRKQPVMDEAAIRKLAKEVLEVLVYLQAFSPPLIHRDIKPANIILSGERPFLVDFGAVQLVTPSDEGGSTIVGTSGYMAPEQLMGRTSASSDLYGLGKTLVWLVTHREPDTLPVIRMRTIWENALSVPISSELKGFIDRLISPMEEDRFADAAAALSALTPKTTTALVRSRPSDTRLELNRSERRFEITLRPNAWSWAGVIACVALSVFGAWSLTRWDFDLNSLAMIGGFSVCSFLISIVLAMSALTTMRLRIMGGTWRWEAGKRVLGQGPVSELRGFSHVNGERDTRYLALLCEDRTYPIFSANRREQEWLDSELRDFLSRGE
jgi:serine/threonine protein kinase